MSPNERKLHRLIYASAVRLALQLERMSSTRATRAQRLQGTLQLLEVGIVKQFHIFDAQDDPPRLPIPDAS